MDAPLAHHPLWGSSTLDQHFIFWRPRTPDRQCFRGRTPSPLPTLRTSRQMRSTMWIFMALAALCVGCCHATEPLTPPHRTPDVLGVAVVQHQPSNRCGAGRLSSRAPDAGHLFPGAFLVSNRATKHGGPTPIAQTRMTPSARRSAIFTVPSVGTH